MIIIYAFIVLLSAIQQIDTSAVYCNDNVNCSITYSYYENENPTSNNRIVSRNIIQIELNLNGKVIYRAIPESADSNFSSKEWKIDKRKASDIFNSLDKFIKRKKAYAEDQYVTKEYELSMRIDGKDYSMELNDEDNKEIFKAFAGLIESSKHIKWKYQMK